MKCMNVMQCNSQRKETQKLKNKEQWSQRKNNEAQGPCQKDSVSLSLLHPKLFRCTSSIGVCIHIRVISNSKIGIKVERLYQFTNKCYRILCLRYWHFWFVCSLGSLQLVTIRMNAACNNQDECVQTSHKNDTPKQAYHASCPQKGQTLQVQILSDQP